ncbi:Uncharacterised protein [Bordetella ansorpii]|uniref:Uncharacterized protein n=1 Tax=Bordetella ansorpii TaxID=288768 RepID=A0A157SG11_9BORD|nr:Uncharacterised protein [Bordetella ansorpii]
MTHARHGRRRAPIAVSVRFAKPDTSGGAHAPLAALPRAPMC